MSDNTSLNPATGGDLIATDELLTLNGVAAPSSLKVQRVKVGFGSDGDLRDVDPANPLPVSVGNFPASFSITASALPTGAATGAAQTTINTSITAMSAKLPTSLGQKTGANSLSVILAGDMGALAITAAALPLPTGAATSLLQTAGNTSVANIDADLGGQADGAAASDTGPASVIALIKRGLQNWTSLLTRIPLLGQALMAASMPVTIASNQSAVNVSPDNVLDNKATTGSISALGDVVSVSTAGFMGGSFHVTAAGTATITYEQSNDGVNWISLLLFNASNATALPQSTTTAAGIYNYNTTAAFIRARVSTYTSGTVAISLVQKRISAATYLATIAQSSTTTMGNLVRASGFTDSSTPLAASAIFTGTGRAVVNTYGKFNSVAFADQPGTLAIDLSVDTGATYRQVASVAVAANVAAILSVPVTGAAGTTTLYRVRYINGATLQTAFQISSSYTAA